MKNLSYYIISSQELTNGLNICLFELCSEITISFKTSSTLQTFLLCWQNINNHYVFKILYKIHPTVHHMLMTMR